MYQYPSANKDPLHAKGVEKMEVHSLETSCDGGGGALGHPKVYLHIDQHVGHISCPYCNRMFILKLLADKH
ncbi:MAG: zinc-finger domain-containing protein [Rickettsiales bacterium]|nr:zinc-finger domain-containing protein [Rickettsiales bacterium]